MTVTAICLFLLGAAAGLFLAIRHFMRRRMPGWVAVAHGVAGAAGFGVLLLFCVREPAMAIARTALGILVFAITLGCVNVVYHLRGRRHRSAIIVAHALAAVTGVGTLAYGALFNGSALAAMPPAAIAASGPNASPASAADPAATAATAADRGADPAAHPGATVAQAAPRLGRVWADRSVQFARDSAIPVDSSSGDIDAVAQELNRQPSIGLVEVQGHCDERGAPVGNLDLARARARAVVDALAARGVAPSRLRSAGYGARCPVTAACARADAPASCHDESSWRQDRRVAFLVLEASGERFHGAVACERARDLIPAEDTPYQAAAAGVGGGN